jgi:glycosyltransferase involved in cell wall biosynthesis
VGSDSPHRPEITVAVASHDRPLRLRWLLNGLEEQTLERGRFEVVVAHDSSGPETEGLLGSHPLAADGTLRHLSFPPAKGSTGRLRNAAWRAGSAPVVAFTDDDCRPPPDWLENALAAARANPGAVAQGRTLPDPDEEHLLQAAPHARSQRINPPQPYAQACNIVYPRGLLERLDGFVEDPPLEAAGEDTDLAERARAAGAPYVAAPEALTYHAVETYSLPAMLRWAWHWQDLVYLIAHQPQARRHFPLGMFWKRTHVWLPVALAGAALARRDARYASLALPWVVHSMPDRGASPRGRLRALSELPGQAAIDAAEIAAMVRGSIRFRTFFL